jgi:GDP-L-fucose synthase
MSLGRLPLDARIYVAGHRGLVGSAIWRLLEQRGYNNVVGRSHAELDLRNEQSVEEFFTIQQPDYVFLAAGRVGGIGANAAAPAEFISDNLRIQVNILDAAHRHGVRRLLFLGSSCIYPKFAPQPIQESALMTGQLEPTNDAYAVAKIAGMFHVRALRREYGRPYISAMPTNLYGPNDHYELDRAHVLPALIRRFHDAKVEQRDEVVLWGSGAPRREFLHADDMASACLFLMENYDGDDHVNVGMGKDISIEELARLIAEVVGFQGRISFDTSKPDGTPRKLLDISTLTGLGWKAEVELREGIASTYRWFVEHPSAPA